MTVKAKLQFLMPSASAEGPQCQARPQPTDLFLLAILHKSLDRAIFLCIFIREVGLNGADLVSLLCTFKKLWKHIKMSFNSDSL